MTERRHIRIVSDGHNRGTKVLDHDGNEIEMVTRIEIQPIDADSGFVMAVITFAEVALDVVTFPPTFPTEKST